MTSLPRGATGAWRRVLVPLDGSAFAEAVLPVAAGLANALELEVVVLRVVEPVTPGESECSHALVRAQTETRMARARQYLTSVALALADRGTAARVRTRQGHPADEIAAEVRESGADLILMTTHGRTGLAGVFIGSVAAAVTRQADIPVLLLRPVPVRAAAEPGADRSAGQSVPRR